MERQIFILRTAFDELINSLNNNTNNSLNQIIQSAYHHCHWFTTTEIIRRLKALNTFFKTDTFERYFNSFTVSNSKYRIAYFGEENIPLEEFMPLIYLIAAGHKVQYKSSSKADKILRWIITYISQYTHFGGKIEFIDDHFETFDKLIITSKKPWPENNRTILKKKYNILELYRNQSVTVIPENVNEEDLKKIISDVFAYYGQGSGNVRKLFLPSNFNLNRIFSAADEWYDILFTHPAYMNNYQYHQSIYLMHRINHLDNGFLILKEDESLYSPLGVLYYSFYNDEFSIRKFLSYQRDLYCVYVHNPFFPKELYFGESVNQLFLPPKEIIDFLR